MRNSIFPVVFTDKIYQIFNSLATWLICCPQLKIFKSIVGTTAIFMMNLFIWPKFSTKLKFHNIAMLSNIPVSYAYYSISFTKTSALIFLVVFTCKKITRTFLAAKVMFKFFKFPWLNPSYLIAKSASKIFTNYSIWTTRFAASCCKCFCSPKNILTFKTQSRTKRTLMKPYGMFNSFFQCHLISPLNKIGRAVVNECRSTHDTPINRKCFSSFVNTLSIEY